ncbi:MAG: aminoglycoside phosphotransferase family protein [Pirellulaceae bacterium]|nr:aminoglycoside phosphotransferase family protein [Pirellulaceae bacterium]
MQISSFVQQHWLQPLGVEHIQPCDSGLSSAGVWRLAIPAGDGCLKAWPLACTPVVRLARIHHCQRMLTDAGLSFIPALANSPLGGTWIESGQHLWEVTSWQAGQPDGSESAGPVRRKAASVALASIHRIWRKNECRVATSPAVGIRIEKIQYYRTQLRQWDSAGTNSAILPWSAEGIGQSAGTKLSDLSRRTIEHFRNSADRLQTQLTALQFPTLVHVALRDIHCQHVLFTGDQVSGVIDFGAVQADEPLIDLVRLLTSLSPRDKSARYETLEWYLNQTTSEGIGVSVLHSWKREAAWRFGVLDEVSTLLSAMQWLDWLVWQERQFKQPVLQLYRRWAGLLERLDCADW